MRPAELSHECGVGDEAGARLPQVEVIAGRFEGEGGVVVRQENYSWSFADYKHMVFFHWVIKNTGAPLRNAWLGLYNELASGNKNSYSNWPPGSNWFKKKQIAWVDSLNMFTERYCLSLPIPGGCFYSTAPEIVGVKLLGVRPGRVSDPDKKVTMQSWNFAPGDTIRDEDRELRIERRQHLGRRLDDGDVEPLFLEIALGQGQQKECRRALEQPVEAEADPRRGLRPARGRDDSQQEARHQCFRRALLQHGYPFFRM